MKRLVLVGIVSVGLFACAAPDCPEGQRKIGTVCVPATDGGRGHVEDSSFDEDRNASTWSSSPGDAGDPTTADTGHRYDGDLPPRQVDDAGSMTDMLDTGHDGSTTKPAETTPPACIPSPEVCDGTDNDCDDLVDEDAKNTCGGCTQLLHAPGDACSAGEGACRSDGRYVCSGTNDTQCDALPNEDAALTWYQDCDGDSYAPADAGTMRSCARPAGVRDCKGWTDRAPGKVDCDDTKATYYPGAEPVLSKSAIVDEDVDSYDGDVNCDGVVEKSGSVDYETVLAPGQLVPLGSRFPLCPTSSPSCGSGTICYFNVDDPGVPFDCGNTSIEVQEPVGCTLTQAKLRLACR